MPLIRWIRDLGRPRVPGTYEVRHMIVRVTERDIGAAEARLHSGSSKDVVFATRIQQESSGACRLGSVICTDPIFAGNATAHSTSETREYV